MPSDIECHQCARNHLRLSLFAFGHCVHLALQILNRNIMLGNLKVLGSVKSNCVLQNSQLYMSAKVLQIDFSSCSFESRWQSTVPGWEPDSSVCARRVSSGWGLGVWLRRVLMPAWDTVPRKGCQSQTESSSCNASNKGLDPRKRAMPPHRSSLACLNPAGTDLTLTWDLLGDCSSTSSKRHERVCQSGTFLNCTFKELRMLLCSHLALIFKFKFTHFKGTLLE